jgi:hypothetical protein
MANAPRSVVRVSDQAAGAARHSTRPVSTSSRVSVKCQAFGDGGTSSRCRNSRRPNNSPNNSGSSVRRNRHSHRNRSNRTGLARGMQDGPALEFSSHRRCP